MSIDDRNARTAVVVARRASSAPARPPRTTIWQLWVRLVALACSASILASAVVVAIPVRPAVAADGIGTGADDVRNMWWVANAEDRLKGPDSVKTLFYMDVLMNMYRADPTVNSVTASDQIVRLMAAVAAQPGNELVSGQAAGWLSVVSKVLPLGNLSQAIIEAAQLAIGQAGSDANSSVAGDDQVSRATDLNVQAMAVASKESELLTNAIAMAHQPGMQQFQIAFNLAFAAATAPTGTATADLIANNPDLQLLQDVRSLIQVDGSIKADLGSIETLLEKNFQTIQRQQASATADLATIINQQADIVKYVKDQQGRQVLAGMRAAHEATEQQYLSIGKSGVYILSTLLGFVNPTLGKQAAVVGNAAIQMVEVISKFATLAANMGGISNAFTSLAGAALTGNFLSAALTIVQLFAPTGPSPDQIILAQVGKLQEMVKGLGQQMQTRFDQIDRELNTIYVGMMTQFNYINIQLGHISRTVVEIQSAVGQLNLRLTEIQRNMYDIISDGFRRDLWNTVDFSLGYQGRSHQPLPYGDYLTADSLFFTWATRHSFDAGAIGGGVRSTKDEDLLAELNAYPLDTNVSYLAQLPQAWGLPALVSQPVPNPRDWYIAARAYTSMNLGYPVDGHANFALADETTAIAAAGRQYQDLEQAIVAGPLDPTDRLNALFRTLLQRYRDKVQSLGDALAAKESEFRTTSPDDNPYQLDPFGDTNQNVPATKKQAFPNVPFCGAGTPSPTQPLGAKAVDIIMPGALQIEKQRGQGAADVCVSAGWGAEKQVDDGNNTIYLVRPLVVGLTANWKPTGGQRAQALSATATTSDFQMCSYPKDLEIPKRCPPTTNAQTVAANNWGAEVQPALDNARVTSWNPAVTGPIFAEVQSYLRTLQSVLYSNIATDLRVRLAPVLTRVEGAKAAIDAYVRVGMPMTLASDEVLNAMLFGTQHILDETSSLPEQYLAAARTPDGNHLWTSIKADNDARLDLLSAAIGGDLTVLGRGYLDGSTAVRSTIERLKLLPGMLNTPALNVLPTSANHLFGPLRPGKTSDLGLRVANVGLGVTALKSITTQGAPFRISANTCGAHLEAVSECTVTVRFAPPAAGPVTGSVVAQSNVAANPTMAALSGGTIDLASSASPGAAGQSVTFTATVASPSGSGGPTGTVQFKDGSTNLAAPVAVNGGVATLSTSSLAAGNHSITGVYSGDPNYSPSTTPTLAQPIIRTNTTTSLTSSEVISPVGVGQFTQKVTFTATVARYGGAQPSGTVQFKDEATGPGVPVTVNGGVALGAPVTVSGGVATLSTSSLTAGFHSVTAIYSGDALFNSSTSQMARVFIVNLPPPPPPPTRTNSTTSLSSSAVSSVVGQRVTFNATVASSGAGTPTGTVEFKDGATSLAAPVAVSGGVATLSTSSLTAGSHTVTATYSGDTTFVPSTSSRVLVFVH